MRALYRRGAPHPRPGAAACAWVSTPAKWWCAPLATTCTWTTRRSGRPRTWRRAWNSWPRPGSIRLTAATLRLVEGLVQVTALGPVPVKGLDGAGRGLRAGRARVAFAGACRRPQRGGSPALWGGRPELAALHAGPGAGRRRAWPGGGRWSGRPAWASRAWSTSCVHSHRTQGWLVLESASVSYGKATPYFPVIDLLQALLSMSRSATTPAPSGPRSRGRC